MPQQHVDREPDEQAKDMLHGHDQHEAAVRPQEQQEHAVAGNVGDIGLVPQGDGEVAR